MEPFHPDDQTNTFLRSNEPQSRRPLTPLPWKQLDSMAKPANFQGKMSLRTSKPLICRFSYAIVLGFFGNLEFRRDFCQKFSWTSINILVMEIVGPDGQIGPFSRSNKPE
ncbi:hypothetical protein H5410_012941 [Solanum commersonii]|uniref:Uncharacterized protein n=1 Tax=Solanum commersonii TaxID=4109 RepID=A0A9J6ATW2_SOLCO|nr:hypothetical protein H5410_012941 [Solanum commersonii]